MGVVTDWGRRCHWLLLYVTENRIVKRVQFCSLATFLCRGGAKARILFTGVNTGCVTM